MRTPRNVTLIAVLQFAVMVHCMAPLLRSQAAAVGATKPPIRGLVSMGNITFSRDRTTPVQNTLAEANAHPGMYSGAILLGKWSDLEPQRGKFDFTSIDAGLGAVRAYNARYPKTPLLAKLDIIGATQAPDWVMAIDGGPLTINHHDVDRLVAHFWIPEYTAAWRELQAALAARYDDNSLIEEVTISSCTPNLDEPTLVPISDHNIPLLLKAGYTNEAQKTCLRGAADDYNAWKHVALDFTFNSWKDIVDGKVGHDETFILSLMDAFRKRFGARGVIGNHGIMPELSETTITLEPHIAQLGAPIEFQTAHPKADWDAAFAVAQKYGVTEWELWDSKAAGGSGSFTDEELKRWRAALLQQN